MEARGLTKDFGSLATVVGLDLDVREGEILGMIGPNGTGKTTVFNVLKGEMSIIGPRPELHLLVRDYEY